MLTGSAGRRHAGGAVGRAGLAALLAVGLAACDGGSSRPTAPEEHAAAAGMAEVELVVRYVAAANGAAPAQGAPAGKVLTPVPYAGDPYWESHDPNQWSAWPAYAQGLAGTDSGPELDQALTIEADVARGTLMVEPGPKYLVVACFGTAHLRYAGATEIEAMEGEPNEALIELVSWAEGPPAYDVDDVRVLVYHLAEEEIDGPEDPDAPALFPDPGLEAAVRRALDKPEGELTAGEVWEVRYVEASRYDVEKIGSLEGIEQMPNLEILDASFGSVADLTPLLGMPRLRSLDLGYLHGEDETGLTEWLLDLAALDEVVRSLPMLTTLGIWGNQVAHLTLVGEWTSLRCLSVDGSFTDVSPLANLTQLDSLWLGAPEVSDVSALANLTQLKYLRLDAPQVSDLLPLAAMSQLSHLQLDISSSAQGTLREVLSGLTQLGRLEVSGSGLELGDVTFLSGSAELDTLILWDCGIRDVSSLEGLTELRVLSLRSNFIADIGSLVRNPGLGDGDFVDVSANPLNSQAYAEHIPALQARGVRVYYDEPAAEGTGEVELAVAYGEITRADIASVQAELSVAQINSTHGPDNQIPSGTVLLFETSEGNLGKMRILVNEAGLGTMSFDLVVYGSDGAVVMQSDSSSVSNTWNYDLDSDTQGGDQPDFWWEWTEFHGGGQPGDPIYLTPRNGALFAVARVEPDAPTPGTISLTLVPRDTTVAAGATFTISVQVADVEALFAASLELTYDPAILEAVSAQPGDFLGDDVVDFAMLEQDLGRASLSVARKRGQPSSTGSGVLATVEFVTLAAGQTEIAIDPTTVALQDSSGADVAGVAELVTTAATVTVE